MFPPEEIAAAMARETARGDQLARDLAAKVYAAIRTDDAIVACEVLTEHPDTVAVELVDGSEFFVTVEQA